MVEDLDLTTARLVPEPNTAAALRLFASQPLVQTPKETKTTLVPQHKAYPRGIPQSRLSKSLIVFIYLFRQASIFTSQRSDSSNRSTHEFPPIASFAAVAGASVNSSSVSHPGQHVTACYPMQFRVKTAFCLALL